MLLEELDEAAALIRVGLRTLRGLRFITDESAAVLTLLSIGSEKMLKTTMGLTALEANQPWPSRDKMRNWGHNLLALNAAATELYEREIKRSTAPGYIQQLLDSCRSDANLNDLLQMLSQWGLQGRFHRLDELAGSPQSTHSPRVAWEQLESQVLAADPALLRKLGEPDGFDEARRRVNQILVDSFETWWQLHTRAWMTGVVGKDAKRLGSTLSRVLDH